MAAITHTETTTDKNTAKPQSFPPLKSFLLHEEEEKNRNNSAIRGKKGRLLPVG